MPSHNKRAGLASIAVLALLVSSQGGCDCGSSNFPCLCDEVFEVCVTKTVCDDEGCFEQEDHCEDACTPGVAGGLLACEPGRLCQPYKDKGICDSCQNERCAARQECVANACRPVQCGVVTPCLDTTQFCDPFVRACYPGNGACSTTSECPQFDKRALETARLECTTGFCSLTPRLRAPIMGLETEQTLEMLSPRPGQQFDSEETFSISWAGPSADAIVLVLGDVPKFSQDVNKMALWGASLTATSPPVLHVSDGVEILEGIWGGPASSLPHDRPLYALVQLVERDRLVAASPPIPFTLGRQWLTPGERCEASESIPGACENPAYVQACIENRCRVLCASDRDCLPWRQACTWPSDGLRYCR
jgi:hypothetical protein